MLLEVCIDDTSTNLPARTPFLHAHTSHTCPLHTRFTYATRMHGAGHAVHTNPSPLSHLLYVQVSWSSDSRMFVSASKDSTLKVGYEGLSGLHVHRRL
jgi:hypothetical protein